MLPVVARSICLMVGLLRFDIWSILAQPMTELYLLVHPCPQCHSICANTCLWDGYGGHKMLKSIKESESNGNIKHYGKDKTLTWIVIINVVVSLVQLSVLWKGRLAYRWRPLWFLIPLLWSALWYISLGRHFLTVNLKALFFSFLTMYMNDLRCVAIKSNYV